MNFIAGKPKGETLAQFVIEGDLGRLKDVARDNNFSGKEKETMIAYPGSSRGGSGQRRVIAAGLGKKERVTVEKIRRAAAMIALRARTLDLTEFSIVPPPGHPSEHARAVVEG